MIERKPQATTMPGYRAPPGSASTAWHGWSGAIPGPSSSWQRGGPAHGPRHQGDERRAADQDQAADEEEVESKGNEKERLADQRQALPHEIQPVGGVESPLEDGTSSGLGRTSSAPQTCNLGVCSQLWPPQPARAWYPQNRDRVTGQAAWLQQYHADVAAVRVRTISEATDRGLGRVI